MDDRHRRPDRWIDDSCYGSGSRPASLQCAAASSLPRITRGLRLASTRLAGARGGPSGGAGDRQYPAGLPSAGGQ